MIKDALGLGPSGKKKIGSGFISMEMSYKPKFGPLGALMDVVMLRRMMEKSMRSVVAGLDEKAAAELRRTA